MSCGGIPKLIFYLSAIILTTFAGCTTVINQSNTTTQNPLIQALHESLEQWLALRLPSNESQLSTGKPHETTLSNDDMKPNTILIRNKRDVNEELSSYDDFSNHFPLTGKRICKRYFTNDVPKKKPAKRKPIYYIDLDSNDGKNILNSLPKIYENSKVLQELKNANLLSLPNKRSPNIKVLTIDLVPKGDTSVKTSKQDKTQEIDQKSLLSSKMGRGEFLILIQQPKSQANINNLLQEMALSGARKDAEDGGGEDSALNAVLTPQPIESVKISNVSSAMSKVLKLFIKSDAYYKDLSSRLNDIYSKIVETKSL